MTFPSRSALFVSGIKHTRRADYSSRRNAIPHTELFLHELFPFLIVNFLFPPLVRFLELSSTIISRPFYNSIPIKRHRFSKFLNSQYNALLSILVTGHHFDDLLRHPWLRVSSRSAVLLVVLYLHNLFDWIILVSTFTRWLPSNP